MYDINKRRGYFSLEAFAANLLSLDTLSLHKLHHMYKDALYYYDIICRDNPKLEKIFCKVIDIIHAELVHYSN